MNTVPMGSRCLQILPEKSLRDLVEQAPIAPFRASVVQVPDPHIVDICPRVPVLISKAGHLLSFSTADASTSRTLRSSLQDFGGIHLSMEYNSIHIDLVLGVRETLRGSATGT